MSWTVVATCDECGTEEVVDYDGDMPRYWIEYDHIYCEECAEMLCSCDNCGETIHVDKDPWWNCEGSWCENCVADIHLTWIEDIFKDDSSTKLKDVIDLKNKTCMECDFEVSEILETLKPTEQPMFAAYL